MTPRAEFRLSIAVLRAWARRTFLVEREGEDVESWEGFWTELRFAFVLFCLAVPFLIHWGSR